MTNIAIFAIALCGGIFLTGCNSNNTARPFETIKRSSEQNLDPAERLAKTDEHRRKFTEAQTELETILTPPSPVTKWSEALSGTEENSSVCGLRDRFNSLDSFVKRHSVAFSAD